jgi:hypothetical protein
MKLQNVMQPMNCATYLLHSLERARATVTAWRRGLVPCIHAGTFLSIMSLGRPKTGSGSLA